MTFDGTSHAPQGAESGTSAALPPPPAPGYFWTNPELATLRAVYPLGGSKAAIAALPNRKRSAILAKAAQLGVRAPKGSTTGLRFASKYPLDERIDQAIRDGYAAAKKRGDYKGIAARVNRPDWWVSKRAAALGVTKTPRTRLDGWTKPELEMLEILASQDLLVIAKKFRAAGFSRTPTAIGLQLKRRKIDRTDPDRWTAPDLAGLLGVNAATIADWIGRRGLKAIKKANGPNGVWLLRRVDVKAWVAANPRFIDLRRVDQTWFMDLVFGRDIS